MFPLPTPPHWRRGLAIRADLIWPSLARVAWLAAMPALTRVHRHPASAQRPASQKKLKMPFALNCRSQVDGPISRLYDVTTGSTTLNFPDCFCSGAAGSGMVSVLYL